MNRLGRLAIVTLGAYLLGGVQSADIAARLAARQDGSDHKDLRAHGTGNPGGLNAAKVLGPRWGLGVMAADVAKGAVASALGRRIAGDGGAYAAGTAAVVGHCLPVWSRFRGGKGIAASAGSAAICFPAYMPIDIAVASATLGISRGSANRVAYVSSSIFLIASVFWWRGGRRNLWGPSPTWGLPVYAALTGGLISWRFYSATVPVAEVGGLEPAPRTEAAA
ncbi:MAG: glycerol-3-phosphate acyltransferase [Chloroflexi bacterium]|nr:glycerol-3-phosphate acyltransferase [Chloroflexota bacterium]